MVREVARINIYQTPVRRGATPEITTVNRARSR
jgi:hypothetical protein